MESILKGFLPPSTFYDRSPLRRFWDIGRECVSTGAAGAQSLGHHSLHPLILRILVLCAPAVLRTRALQDAHATADSKS